MTSTTGGAAKIPTGVTTQSRNTRPAIKTEESL